MNSIHIAREYIAHGDLYQYMTSNVEKVKKEAKVITPQILAGLVVLHQREICHRDLKPQVDRDYFPRQVDYTNGTLEHPDCLSLADIDQNHGLRNLKALGRTILTYPLRNSKLPSPRATWTTAEHPNILLHERS